MSVRVIQISVDGFDDNFSYIIHDDVTKEGYIVDPCGKYERVVHAIKVLKIKVIGILITHTHHDHIDALATMLELFTVPVYVHIKGKNSISATKVVPLTNNQTLPLSDRVIKVLETPGHADDAVCYYIEQHNCMQPQLITGDTLFVGGCGRTNAAGVKDLYNSLQMVKKLPAETTIFPGHDYGSTPTALLRDQLVSNCYLATDQYETFKKQRLPNNTV